MALTADEVMVRLRADAQQYQQAMNSAAATAGKVDASFDKVEAGAKQMATSITASAAKANGSMNSMQGSVGTIAAQFNDIGVTAAMGMSPMLIALQQGTQLSQAFASQGGNLRSVVSGVGSAFASIVSPVSLVTIGLTAVAAVAIQVATGFFKAGDEAEDLGDQIADLKSAVDDYRSAAENARLSTEELSKKYGTTAIKVKELLDVTARLAELEALKQLSESVGAVQEQFTGLKGLLDTIQNPTNFGPGNSGLIFQQSDAMAQLKEEYGLTVEQAERLVEILNRLSAAGSGTREQAFAARELATYLADSTNNAANLSDGMLDALRVTVNTALAASEFVAEAENGADAVSALAGGIDVAVGGAESLADRIASIDFSSPISAAQQLGAVISGLIGQARSLLNVLNAGQSLRAAASSVAESDAAGSIISGVKNAVDGAWKAAQDRIEQIESGGLGQRPTSRTFDVSERAAYGPVSTGGGGSGRKSGGGGSRTKREEKPFFEDAQRDLEQLQRQIDLIGKSNEEIAVTKARWELLDEAKKRGIPINETLNAQIEAQAGKFGQLTAELERQEISQQQYEQAIDGIAGAMSQALIAGESLREGLAQVFAQIAQDILSSGIRSALQGQFSAAGGGGFLGGVGGLFKGLIPGFAGGGMHSGGLRIVGENGPELEATGPSRILNAQQISRALVGNRSSQSSPSSMNITVQVDGANGDQHVIDLVQQGVSRGLGAYDKSLPDRVKQVNQNPRRR